MGKPKLTKDQNLALRDLTLPQKLNKLHQWHKEGVVNEQTFNYFSNLWIAKDTKKVIGLKQPLRRGDDDCYYERCSIKTVIEVEMEQMLGKLRCRLNKFLTDRDWDNAKITSGEIAKFQSLISERRRKDLRDRLLIVGLRYPDKKLNGICADTIKRERKGDIAFWSLLWEDGNIVPMDAVRMMLDKKNGMEYVINNDFHPALIKSLIPLIETQRDKEITRLTWAQELQSSSHDREVARKTRRLEGFNILLQAASEYISE